WAWKKVWHASMDPGAQVNQGHAISTLFAKLTNLGRRKIALREDPAEPKTTQAVGIHAIGFSFILGQYLNRRWMTQMRIQTQFVQQVGNPRPTEGGFHRHGSRRRQLRQLLPHGHSIRMLQAHALYAAQLPHLA